MGPVQYEEEFFTRFYFRKPAKEKRENAAAYLVGDSAGVQKLVGHDDSQRRSKGPLRAEAQRDLGVAGEVGAVDALWRSDNLNVKILQYGTLAKL